MHHFILSRKLKSKSFNHHRRVKTYILGLADIKVKEQPLFWFYTILYFTGSVITASLKFYILIIPECFVNVSFSRKGFLIYLLSLPVPQCCHTSGFFSKHTYPKSLSWVDDPFSTMKGSTKSCYVLDSLGKNHSSSSDNLFLWRCSGMYLQISSFRITLSQR